MRMRNSWLFVVCLALVATFSPAAEKQAIPDVVKLIPQTSWGFLLINHLSATNQKFVEVESQLQLPAMVNPLTVVKMVTGMEGIDESREAALVIVPCTTPNAKFVPLLFIPVIDYDKLVASLHPDAPPADITSFKLHGLSFFMRKVNNFAVFAMGSQITDQEHRTLFEKVGTGPSIAQNMPVAWKSWLSENDLAIVATSGPMQLGATLLRDKIADIEKRLSHKPEKDAPADDQKLRENAQQMIAGLKLYADLATFAEKELKTSGLGIQRDSVGVLRVTKRVAFVEGGKAAELLADISPSQATPFANMPKSDFLAAFSGVVPEKLTKAWMHFSTTLMTANLQSKLSPEQIQKFAEYMENAAKQIRGAHQEIVLFTGKPGEGLLSRMAGVLDIDDAQAYLDRTEANFQSFHEIFKGKTTPFPFPSVGAKKIQIAGKSALKFTVDMDFNKMLPQDDQAGAEAAKNLINRFVGPNGKIVAYMAVAGPHTILLSYNSQERVLEALKVLEKKTSSLSENKGIAATSTLLPAHAPWVGYWNPNLLVDYFNFMFSFARQASPHSGLPSDFRFPAFPQTSPIGCAVTINANEIQSTTVIPPDVI